MHPCTSQTNVPILLGCVALQKVFFFSHFHMQKKPEAERKKKKISPTIKKASIHVMLVLISEHLKIHDNFWEQRNI